MRIVREQKSAPRQVFADACRLRFGEGPSVPVFHVNPWPVEQFVAIRVHDLFHGPGVQARQTAQATHELPVRLRVVRRPKLETSEAAVRIPRRWKVKAGESPLRLFVRVHRQGRCPVLFLIAALLHREQTYAQSRKKAGNRDDLQELHWNFPDRSIEAGDTSSFCPSHNSTRRTSKKRLL